MKRLRHLTAVLFSLIPCFALAISSPVPMLEDASNQIIATLKANRNHLRNNHRIINDAVREHLLPIVDVQGMSRSAVGRRAWKSASSSERHQFTKEFVNLVIRTYANPLSEYTNETIKFLPIRGPINDRFAKVNSMIIRSSGPNIPLTYSLVAKNGHWKVYDLSVEGVSLLQSFRSQFRQALQDASMSSLIAQMKSNQIKGS